MADISHRLLDGEVLRAVHVPAMSSTSETQESGWRITLRTNGELIGHRNNSPLVADPSILLADADYETLLLQLDDLGVDYEPKSSCDGTEYRFLTYLSQSHSRHITYVDGVSQDFERFDDFDQVWRHLGLLARQVGF